MTFVQHNEDIFNIYTELPNLFIVNSANYSFLKQNQVFQCVICNERLQSSEINEYFKISK